MATRTFCDHCGNTVREPQVFSYGPLVAIRQYQEMLYQQQRMMMQSMQQASSVQSGGTVSIGAGGGGSGGAGGAGVFVAAPTVGAPTAPTAVMVNVDLCDHCVPIWLQRVAAITKDSDPEGE